LQIEPHGQACSEDEDVAHEIEGHDMTWFAETVLAILAIAVIGLAVWSGKLRREKELLLEELLRTRENERGKSPERGALQAEQEIAEAPPIKAASSSGRDPVAPSGNGGWTYEAQNTSCPECGCTKFEMRTYGGPWEYADTHCDRCGRLIRRFDAA
jgi:hypothetical protein